jgi:hypothetical protein
MHFCKIRAQIKFFLQEHQCGYSAEEDSRPGAGQPEAPCRSIQGKGHSIATGNYSTGTSHLHGISLPKDKAAIDPVGRKMLLKLQLPNLIYQLFS